MALIESRMFLFSHKIGKLSTKIDAGMHINKSLFMIFTVQVKSQHKL